ncbi:MAG: hypothetical protein COC15_01565 [Legionellales bacterium]|nr:MAG: hypothetical protein COC15_01565 [Legionellales bacterium]
MHKAKQPKKPEYGLIGHSFWANRKIQQDFSCEAKLIATYLLSCPQIRPYGFVRIVPSILSDILCIDLHAVCVAIKELIDSRFLYCHATEQYLHLYIPLWFHWCGIRHFLQTPNPSKVENHISASSKDVHTSTAELDAFACEIKQQIHYLREETQELKQLLLQQFHKTSTKRK